MWRFFVTSPGETTRRCCPCTKGKPNAHGQPWEPELQANRRAVEIGGVRCLCYVVVLHAIAGSRSYIRVMVVGVRGLRGRINKNKFELFVALRSREVRGDMGVWISPPEVCVRYSDCHSRIYIRGGVTGPRKRINEKKCNLLSAAALRSREVRGDMSAWI